MNKNSLSLVVFVTAVVLLAASSATADVGVEKVSRLRGTPGQEVRLTVGCGACTRPARTPASFPISLVPVNKVPKPHRCGAQALCPPSAKAVPRRAPFTFLGAARRSEDEDGSHSGQRYVLEFEIPKLATGRYTYVIYCDACLDGKGGTLITNPNPKPSFWRLGISAVARGTP
jgi:hypothetical protein